MYCPAPVNARPEVPWPLSQATIRGGDTCSPVAAFLFHVPGLWMQPLSNSVTRVWDVGCAGKAHIAIAVGWEGRRRSSVHLFAGQVNAGAESSPCCQSKAQVFPGVFQGRVYCSVNTISFQRSAFLKILQVSRKYFSFTCSCH